MAKPEPTPQASESGEEVLTPLQMMLAGTFLLSIVLVPLSTFVMYLAPFYKAEGALYRGDYWLFGGIIGIAFSAFFSWFWMTKLPGLLETRRTKREARAVAKREERRLEKKRVREQELSDRAAKVAALAAEEE